MCLTSVLVPTLMISLALNFEPQPLKHPGLAASLRVLSLHSIILMIWKLTHSPFAVTISQSATQTQKSCLGCRVEALLPACNPNLPSPRLRELSSFRELQWHHHDGIDWSADNDMSSITEMSGVWSHQEDHYHHYHGASWSLGNVYK